MAEATLRAVPSTDESIQQQPITTKAPDKASPLSSTCPLVVTDLNKKVKDAERLLFYAAETGIAIENNVRDAVLKAKFASADNWDEQTAANLLSALTTLTAKLKPVTADSLKECTDEPTVKLFISWYKRMTIVLAFCIIPFSWPHLLHPQFPRRFVRILKLRMVWPSHWGMKLGLFSAQDGQPKRCCPARIAVRDLQEFAATMRAINARAWQLKRFLVYSK